MNKFLFPLTMLLLVTFAACKPATTETTVEPTLNPFNALVVRHTVKDFGIWKSHFLAHDSLRMAYGIDNLGVGRGIDDTSMVVVINAMTDVTKAKAFIAMPELKAVMDSAGVTGAPTIELLNVLRNDTATIAQRERLMVSHHVKDFAAWLKVYDREGKETRSQHGLIDRALARGMEDTNMVYVVFAVTDMEKASARGKSEELKKLMEEAGVDSEPAFLAYRFDFLNE